MQFDTKWLNKCNCKCNEINAPITQSLLIQDHFVKELCQKSVMQWNIMEPINLGDEMSQ